MCEWGTDYVKLIGRATMNIPAGSAWILENMIDQPSLAAVAKFRRGFTFDRNNVSLLAQALDG